MIETITGWLALIGWSSANLQALGIGAAVSTVAAWTLKYPLRLWTESRTVPLATFKWLVRLIAGVGAMVGTELSWPVHGRIAWLGGLVSWAIVLLLYKFSGPLVQKFAPWLSSDVLASKDDSDDSGV